MNNEERNQEAVDRVSHLEALHQEAEALLKSSLSNFEYINNELNDKRDAGHVEEFLNNYERLNNLNRPPNKSKVINWVLAPTILIGIIVLCCIAVNPGNDIELRKQATTALSAGIISALSFYAGNKFN